VRMDGHSDLVGNARYNLRLSRQRGEAVRRYLVRAGIESERLATSGYGETLPQVRARDRRASALNRRVAFGYQAPAGVNVEALSQKGDLQMGPPRGTSRLR
jgi:outer membrane protein OmpA-like peptidoglycan-associated protein